MSLVTGDLGERMVGGFRIIFYLLCGISFATSCKVRRLPDDFDSDLQNAVRGKNPRLENGVQFQPKLPAVIARNVDGQGNELWGTPYNIDIITSAGLRMFWEYSRNGRFQGAPDPLVVGDMSKEKGGPLGGFNRAMGRWTGHKSHRMGLDTDVSYYDTRGAPAKPTTSFLAYTSADASAYFDSERNLRFVEILNEEARRCGTDIVYIFSVKPLIAKMHQAYLAKNAGKLSLQAFMEKYKLNHEDNHHNHFHVRVQYLDQEQCVVAGAKSPEQLAAGLGTYQAGAGSSQQGERGRLGGFNSDIESQDEPFGENCGFFQTTADTEAQIYEIITDARSAGFAAPAYKKGQIIMIPRGRTVVCVDEIRTPKKRRLMEFGLFDGPDAEALAHVTFAAIKADFTRIAAPMVRENGELSPGTVDAQEIRKAPVDCTSIASSGLVVTRGPLVVHEIDYSSKRKIGMLASVLREGDLVQAAGTLGDQQQWTVVRMLSGEDKGRTGAVYGKYLEPFTKDVCNDQGFSR